MTTVERDTYLSKNSKNCLNLDLLNAKGSPCVKDDELSKTPEKVMINKWLVDQSNHKSNASTHSSRESEISRNLGCKVGDVSEEISENHKFMESAKKSMLRAQKRLEMQLSLIDSSLATGDVELVRTETANLDRIFV